MRDGQRIRVCVAGITSWTGGPVAEAVGLASDLELVSSVSRKAAGRTTVEVVGSNGVGGHVFATVGEAEAFERWERRQGQGGGEARLSRLW